LQGGPKKFDPPRKQIKIRGAVALAPLPQKTKKVEKGGVDRQARANGR
jgi:hypothetical protein